MAVNPLQVGGQPDLASYYRQVMAALQGTPNTNQAAKGNFGPPGTAPFMAGQMPPSPPAPAPLSYANATMPAYGQQPSAAGISQSMIPATAQNPTAQMLKMAQINPYLAALGGR